MSIQQKLQANGIKYQTFYSRVTIMGWSREDAASIPPAPIGKYGKRRPTPRGKK